MAYAVRSPHGPGPARASPSPAPSWGAATRTRTARPGRHRRAPRAQAPRRPRRARRHRAPPARPVGLVLGESRAAPIPAGAPSDVVTGLDVPWSIAFLPQGDALVTLRDRGRGAARLADGHRERASAGSPASTPAARAACSASPSPRPSPPTRRCTSTSPPTDDNRVVRTTLGAGGFGPMTPVLTGIPKAGNHNGGRIAWGPDGFLYVATGDAARDRAVAGPRAASAARSCASPATARPHPATRPGQPRVEPGPPQRAGPGVGRPTGRCTPASSARTRGTSSTSSVPGATTAGPRSRASSAGDGLRRAHRAVGDRRTRHRAGSPSAPTARSTWRRCAALALEDPGRRRHDGSGEPGSPAARTGTAGCATSSRLRTARSGC